MVCAQPRAQQSPDTFDVGLHGSRVAANDPPSDAPPRGEVVFRESAKRDDGHIGSDGGEGYLRVVVEDELVVNLVREDDEVVAARQFGDRFQHATRTHRARWIVGIDQHNTARARTDLLVNVDEVGLPAVILVEGVRVQFDAKLCENGRVQRIVRAGSQQVVAGIEQRAETNVDRFTHTRSDEYILHTRDAFALSFTADRVDGFLDPRRRRVAVLTVLHGFVDGFDQVSGRLEVEVDGVADIQRQDLVALLGNFVGHAGQITDGVADILQTLGSGNFPYLSGWHLNSGSDQCFVKQNESLTAKSAKHYRQERKENLSASQLRSGCRCNRYFASFAQTLRTLRCKVSEDERLTTND